MQAFDYDIEITYEKGSYFDKLLTKEREKGYRERALKAARKMLKAGLSLEQIANFLDLTEEEIEILKQEIEK